MTRNELIYVEDELYRKQLDNYINNCRLRIPEFANANFSWHGAFSLNSLAFGRDILVAPFNFLMGLPNFILQVIAVVLEVLKFKKIARFLLLLHIGIQTEVQQCLRIRLMTDLLDLPLKSDQTTNELQRHIASAASKPVDIYLQTRNVAADITAATFTLILGIIVLNQFTPGSISAGSAVAQVITTERAASEFFLGETLGQLYYSVFPVSPSLILLILTLLLVMTVIAVVAAFSGIIHDPIQKITGIHQRRLDRLIDAIEEGISGDMESNYRPRDTYLGRVYDVLDWIKGIFSL